MKITSIFDEKLYSFYSGKDKKKNEYNLAFNRWYDPLILLTFFDKNRTHFDASISREDFVNNIIDNAHKLNDIINDCLFTNNPLGAFFQNLNNSEYKAKHLSEQKGKRYCLRLYAIRIDENCFVITGGAIKITNNMSDHEDTAKELIKLQAGRKYLLEKGFFDLEGFLETLKEDGE